MKWKECCENSFHKVNFPSTRRTTFLFVLPLDLFFSFVSHSRSYCRGLCSKQDVILFFVLNIYIWYEQDQHF